MSARTTFIAAILSLALGSLPVNGVIAETHNISVQSGQRKQVASYAAWKRDCTPDSGIVKAVSKPQHGKLFPGNTVAAIKRNRFRSSDPCIGTPMKKFTIDYQSAAGYRGTDTFTVEATFGKRAPEIDVYLINVY
ncbi:hypothetical protein JQ596_37140 [Bradyrhizobium manausense]|uniref:hypothetical protein n=1 Tax=Bradyrhizobium arachidis TaxID=858423 RepID=UPI0021631CC5|nr:hypothetical protein [Bradyrhizobium arachidis]MBR0831148.1 hypothetical protein [Bradyrhizobium manausense]UVO29181.1 hypothetical protein KUF59_43385 [Bradyrhizobium arachidis]